jgi:uncharacterized protein YbaR (Trm112 family)
MSEPTSGPSARVPADLLALLACPSDDHAPLREQDGRLVCTACGRSFPIVDGIPVLLLDEATAGTPDSGPAEGSDSPE